MQQIHAAGARACVALNPGTPASTLDAILPEIDQVLVMTVNPGFGGQAFIDSTLPKLLDIRRRIRRARLDIDLVVDGGISLDTVESVATHGAEVFVMGNAFFGSPDRAAYVKKVRDLLEPYEVPANDKDDDDSS